MLLLTRKKYKYIITIYYNYELHFFIQFCTLEYVIIMLKIDRSSEMTVIA